MARRCRNTNNLEVHHIRRDGGNGLNNAQVLCSDCHANTSTYGTPGNSPEEFSEAVKLLAKFLAGYRCQCTRDDCHD